MGKNNVNPDYYKTRGRERQGEDIVQEVHKQQYAQAQAKHHQQDSFLPGAKPASEKNNPEVEEESGKKK
jgi:hypothetical protein